LTIHGNSEVKSGNNMQRDVRSHAGIMLALSEKHEDTANSKIEQ